MKKDLVTIMIFIASFLLAVFSLCLNGERFRDNAEALTFLFGVGVGGVLSIYIISKIKG